MSVRRNGIMRVFMAVFMVTSALPWVLTRRDPYLGSVEQFSAESTQTLYTVLNLLIAQGEGI